VWFIVGICCILPLIWLATQILVNPSTLKQLAPDSYRLALLGRTLLYNGSVGLLATLLAIPAAWVLGRGRGVFASALWLVMPISLLMPSLVIAYGWKQLIRLVTLWTAAHLNIDIEFAPAGFWDILRCIWTLAAWLWPVPAIIIGMALRRSDPQVQQQAVLDGVVRRVTLRQLSGSIIASICIVSILAMQEFAVYEPTGISVVATEVRMVFETGAYSSLDNPITQPMGQGAPARDQQEARAAAAIGTAMPMLITVILLGLLALLGTRRLSAAEHVEVGAWPRVLDASMLSKALAWLIVVYTLGSPMLALFLSLKRRFDLPYIYTEFTPQVLGTLLIAAITGVVAMTLALCASPRRWRGLFAAALLSFLIGGQILSICLIRLYNREHLDWVYNQAPIIVMAYIGRFGWIVLAATLVTWSQPWRQLRDLAAIDGADTLQTARYVIWPLAWPILGAASMFVLILSLSEVPATVLIAPSHPQVLTPMLMTWLHMLRYDDMIEVSLLMAGMVVTLGAVAVAMGRLGVRLSRIIPLILITLLLTSGCRDRSKPEAIWCTTGIGPAQVVYPRGITYNAKDDSFFIVDRAARVQHLDNQGHFLAGWKMPEFEQGKPVGISVGPDGDVYVADTHYHRVMVYSPTGELVKQWGSRGTEPGQFISPTDIAFDDKGHIFVAEYGDNDRIQVFDHDGKFLYKFGSFGGDPGQLSRPQSMVIVGQDLYIADSCNHRIAVYKTDGTFVRVMGKAGGELGEFRFPYGLDIDSNGRLVVCEFGNERVQLIDRDTGKGLEVWGTDGRDPGELKYPWAVAIDKHGRIVTVDSGNNRLQVFEF
jgi:ABC-type Fe3+ transport system permease subunit/sugar lactone lactonase YvrE